MWKNDLKDNNVPIGETVIGGEMRVYWLEIVILKIWLIIVIR